MTSLPRPHMCQDVGINKIRIYQYTLDFSVHRAGTGPGLTQSTIR
jgi:hypothetical protein